MLNHPSLGLLFLRIFVGGMMLFHGVAKIKSGISMIESSVVSHGFPSYLAYGVYMGEIIAPIMILVGYYARIGALLSSVTMLAALYLVHKSNLFSLNEYGAPQAELAYAYLFGSLSIMFLGAGKFSISGGSGQLN